MFTGIVEIVGTVTTLESLDQSDAGGGGTSLTISDVGDILSDARLGDSICINGTCLTVTQLESTKAFKVGISPETLRRTNLGALEKKSNVNLERALLPSTRIGGHFLQGHVDTTARIVDKRADGNAVTFRLAPRDQSVLRHVVEKGYVALDGASLTVTAVKDPDSEGEGWFEVMLIAYTQERVVMAAKDKGADVNIEVDMVGKYVEKSVASYFEGKGSSGSMAVLEKIVNRVVDEKTRR
ncbi:MAG: Riboflavin synthase alpha chain [Chrysothrix sp. TS-e1954]|nr:MAG: Riboflavin synthase alpha chain [Chrysothrix sp. TS-e1954]